MNAARLVGVVTTVGPVPWPTWKTMISVRVGIIVTKDGPVLWPIWKIMISVRLE